MGDEKTRTAVTVPIASKSFEQSVLKKVHGPCDWSENDRKLVFKYAYTFPINLWQFFTRRFFGNQKPSNGQNKDSDWIKPYV